MTVMAQQDYYKILGVSEQATADEIKKAYRKKAMQLHPDRHSTSKDKSKEQLQHEFAQLQEAYNVLSDPNKRSLYDAGQWNAQTGSAHNTSQFDFEEVFSEFGDLFGNIFGGGRRNTYSSYQTRGADLRYTLSLNLEDIVFGCNRSIQLTRLGKCSVCEGTGSSNKSMPSNCSTCQGKGRVLLQRGPFNIQQTCPNCRGQGKHIDKPCTGCRGTGQIREKRALSVKVPKGMTSGDQIRLHGEGEAGIQGGPSGDLYIQVQIAPHPLFRREGDNLLSEMPVSYTVATLGGEVEVPTMEGKVKVRIPKGTANGKIFKLKGKGVPKVNGYGSGDLLLTLMVEVPTQLSSEQMELLKAFEASLQQSSTLHYPSIKGWMESIKHFFTPNDKNRST